MTVVTWEIKFVGERVGEAKNPGPNSFMRIAFGNVSSYILHQDYINTVPCDVLGMSETRLNNAGFKLVQDSLEDLNWSFVPGISQPQRRPGVEGRYLDAMPGGVGFLIKKHIPHVRTTLLLDEFNEDERRRVVSVTMLPGNGLEPVRLFQVYGYARARDDAERLDLNERLLSKVFKEAAACGPIPVVVMGDFNIDPAYSRTVTDLLVEGTWVDAAAIRPSFDGSDPPWTFQQKGVTSRIDICLLNGSAMHLFWDFEQWNHESCTIPNHKIQCITLKLGSGKQFAKRPMKPYSIPDYFRLPPLDIEHLTSDIIELHIEKLYASFEKQDIEEYWVEWCRLAENWLLYHCAISTGNPALAEDPGYKGRGHFRVEEKCVNMKTKDVNNEGNTVDPRLASALKIRRILDEIIIKQNLASSIEIELEVSNLWRKASRIAWSDCKVYQTDRLRYTVEAPSRKEVIRIRDEVHDYVNKRGAQLRRLRLRRLREVKNKELIQNPSCAFASIRNDAEPPLAALKRSDGTITGNVVEMDKILREKWCTIFCKHNVSYPPPKAEPFLEKYKEFISEHPMALEPINVADVRKRLNKCKDTGATGLDAWSPKDFKRLPDEILEYLCLFFDMVEKGGVWPYALTHAAVSLIPKNEGCEPLSLRPISVLPIAYRLWAAVRCKHCAQWQEEWITDGQHGCREKHGTSDALLRLSAELENAYLEGKPLYGVALDFAKAFDNVPVSLTLDLLKKLGLDSKILKPLTYMYENLKRYFKIRGFIGEPFKASNGIMQGCPLSCLLLNALVSILARSVQAEVHNITMQSYVDDITMLHKDLEQLQAAIRILEPYLELTQQKLNVTKTYTFAVNDDSCVINFQEQTLPFSNSVKILGVKFYFGNGGVAFFYTEADLQFVEPTLARIRSSNLPFWARCLVIAGAVISKINYGSEIRQLEDSQERNVKNSITGAVWGSSSRKRTPGVLYTVLTKGHTLDLSQAVLTSRWMKISRALRNDPSLGDILHRNFRLRQRQRLRKSGPGEALAQSSRRLRLWYETSSSIRCGDTIYDLLSCNMGKLGHELREAGRNMVWKQVRADALRDGRVPGEPPPHLHDLGNGSGVNREDTMKLYNATKDNSIKGTLRIILCNGVWTASARAKLPQNAGLSPICQYCRTGRIESLRHIWWECPGWEIIRRKIFPDSEDPFVDYGIDKLPDCTQTCGIKNLDTDVNVDLIVKIQSMMVNIFRERALRQSEPCEHFVVDPL